MKKVLLLLFICFFSTFVNAGKVYDFNALCQQAYQEIIRLKLNSGQAFINKAKQQNPDNLVPVALENYIDFYTLFFNEDPAHYKAYQKNISTRIDLLKEGPENSPFYNFYLGMAYMQRASIEIKFGNKWDAGWDFKKAYGYVKNNKKSFPTFTPNDLLFGPMQAMIGTIPSNYKWVAGLFGMKGSIKKGMATMNAFLNSSDPWARIFFNEAAFLNCYLMFYVENDKDAVFEFIKSRRLDVVNNHLFTYMAVNLGIHNKMSDYAEQVLYNRNKSAEYLVSNAWDYQMSMVKLHKLDLDDAAFLLEKFLREFKGKTLVKDAYQKLGWCYYLQGNQKAADLTRKKLLANGSTASDQDKKAQKDAKAGGWPNVLLLKSRLLSDGGYNQQALTVLKGKSKTDFKTIVEQLEFVYRLGRIYDDLKQDNEALNYYQQTIQIGQNRSEYFASRAALQAGQIYERNGQKSMALKYYEKAIDMEDHEYEDSIEQRAKAGIQRCKGE